MSSWFEEQLASRRQSDREVMSGAYENAVNAIIGESFSFDEAEDELSSILTWYHLPTVSLPERITDENEKLSVLCRMSGLMQRPVELDKGWYQCAFGAFLCRLRDSGEYVAVLPGKFSGYGFYDKKQRKHIRLNKKTEGLLDDKAICFYKPLPSDKLSLYGVIKYAVSSWSLSDHFFTYGLLAVSTLVGLLLPKVSYFLYGKVVEEESVSLLISTMVFLFAVTISRAFLTSMQSIFNSRSSVKMGAALESAGMMRTLSLTSDFFRQFSSGEIMTRMRYLQSVSQQIVSMIFSTSLSCLFSLVYITQIFAYAPALVVPSLLVIIANTAFSLITTFRQLPITKRQMEMEAKNNALQIEMISGVQKIKMSGAEKRMFARYTTEFSKQEKLTFNPPLFLKYNGIIANAISFAGQFLIYYLTIGAGISAAEYYAFQTSYGMISGAIAGLAGIAIQAASMKPGIEMVRPLLNAVPENHRKAQEIDSLSGNIEINNISFRYDDNSPNVLDDFSLKIKAGQYITIVGKTGCGKSTLVRLLLGFETPQKGAIYYDSKDLRIIDKRSLRQKIGTVMQDNKLFTGDIYSNIVICAPTLPMSRAWEAAEIAGIADDIRKMPMGMHTLISEGSGGISGGQRQRIAIARAVAPKPKILIFDEATSALDNITQKKVSDALDSLKCTRIVIAHRLSTIRHSDRIIVLEKGKIIEDGTYEELIARNGYFAELVARQRLDTQQEE